MLKYWRFSFRRRETADFHRKSHLKGFTYCPVGWGNCKRWSWNENLIQEAISELIAHKTIVVIAHKLSTIKNADTILVIEDGQIIDRGKHIDLVQKDGLYKTLWKKREKTFKTIYSSKFFRMVIMQFAQERKGLGNKYLIGTIVTLIG